MNPTYYQYLQTYKKNMYINILWVGFLHFYFDTIFK